MTADFPLMDASVRNVMLFIVACSEVSVDADAAQVSSKTGQPRYTFRYYLGGSG